MSEPKSVHVVTGGGGGMGLACARRLGRNAPVVLAEVNEAGLEAAEKELRADGIEVDGVVCDVASADSVASLVEKVAARGSLGALAHTAGLSPMMASGERIYEVNLIGTALVLDAFLPLTRPGSACVCVASMAGYGGEQQATDAINAVLDDPLRSDFLERLQKAAPDLDVPGAAYALSKWGVRRLVMRGAGAWAARGARIVSISPGIIDTPMGRFESERQPVMNEMVKRTPLGRMGTADEIASVVEFLCSEGASYVTGVDLLVDGGVTPAMRPDVAPA